MPKFYGIKSYKSSTLHFTTVSSLLSVLSSCFHLKAVGRPPIWDSSADKFVRKKWLEIWGKDRVLQKPLPTKSACHRPCLDAASGRSPQIWPKCKKCSMKQTTGVDTYFLTHASCTCFCEGYWIVLTLNCKAGPLRIK